MLSVNWATKVIFVPKTYTQFVQFEPITGLEVRQLDLDQFRLDLKAIEASAEGIPFLDMHEHTAPKTLGGVTYARFVEIINGYTVEFEDGQYAVNLVGANTNVQDVTIVNQVSIRPSNSAGLTFSEEINSQSFTLNRVYIHDDDGQPGTQFPRGTPTDPVDNFPDASAIATSRKLNSYDLTTHLGVFTLPASSDISQTNWYGSSARTSRLDLNSAIAVNCNFDGLFLQGTLTSGPIAVRDGNLTGVTNFSGGARETAISGTITLDNTATEQIVFRECFSAVAGTGRPVLDLNGITVNVSIRGYHGGLTIRNMSQNIDISFDGDVATLELEASCTNGTINVGGITYLIDNSVGTTVVKDRRVTELTQSSSSLTPTDIADIADAVWDETLADHLSAGSTGEALDSGGSGGTCIDNPGELGTIFLGLTLQSLSFTKTTIPISGGDNITPVEPIGVILSLEQDKFLLQ